MAADNDKHELHGVYEYDSEDLYHDSSEDDLPEYEYEDKGKEAYPSSKRQRTVSEPLDVSVEEGGWETMHGKLRDMLTCMITGELLVDPVLAEDGITYSRAAILKWFHTWFDTNDHLDTLPPSPHTGLPFTSIELVDNRIVKQILHDLIVNKK